MGVSATCDHCAPTSKWDGAIVSFRPNGSDLRLYASRIRAPVGLAYLPGTERSVRQHEPAGQPRRPDARTTGCAIVQEGQDWRFPACYGQGGPACAGRSKAGRRARQTRGRRRHRDSRPASSGRASVPRRSWPSGTWRRFYGSPSRRPAPAIEGTVTPFLTGIRNPLALAIAPDRSLLVGDWATGKIYRIAPAS